MSTVTTDHRAEHILRLRAAGWNQADAEALAAGQNISVPEYMRCPVAQSTPAFESSKRNESVAREIDRDTSGELEQQLRDIEEQLVHWADVKDSAGEQIAKAKQRIAAAQETLAEVSSSAGQQAKYDRKQAQDVIDTQTIRLEFAENRLKNAEGQLKSWKQRKKDFPMDKFNKLRKEDERRRKMSGR